MTICVDLISERGWSVDDALHEVTFMRAEMASGGSSLDQKQPDHFPWAGAGRNKDIGRY